MDDNAVTAFALNLASMYGLKTTISWGKIHEYLVMDMDWGTSPGTMILSIVKYLAKIIKEFPEVLTSAKAAPTAGYLLKIQEDGKKLPNELARQFQRTTAQLLFLCKRARPGVKTLVSFLTTRVKEPDKDDWSKLNHGLMYLKGTLYMKRHMKADALNIIRWWVDSSYGVH